MQDIAAAATGERENRIVASTPDDGVVAVAHGDQVAFLAAGRRRILLVEGIGEGELRVGVDLVVAVAHDDDVLPAAPVDDVVAVAPIVLIKLAADGARSNRGRLGYVTLVAGVDTSAHDNVVARSRIDGVVAAHPRHDVVAAARVDDIVAPVAVKVVAEVGVGCAIVDQIAIRIPVVARATCGAEVDRREVAVDGVGGRGRTARVGVRVVERDREGVAGDSLS